MASGNATSKHLSMLGGDKDKDDLLYNGLGGNSSEHSSPLLRDYNKHSDKYIIPPPEDLIAKSVFIVEPIRTGAPISFV